MAQFRIREGADSSLVVLRPGSVSQWWDSTARSAALGPDLSVSLADVGKQLLARLEADLRAPRAERDSRVDDDELRTALKFVHEMVDRLATGSFPPPERRYPELTYHINDRWPAQSDLAADLAEFERQYIRFGRS